MPCTLIYYDALNDCTAYYWKETETQIQRISDSNVIQTHNHLVR